MLDAGNGATAERADGWTYVAPANIADVSPANGQIGTRVIVSGTGLLAGGSKTKSVTFAGVAATITSSNDTHLEVVIAAEGSDTTGAIVMVSDAGGELTSADDAWEYLDASSIGNVSPSSGQIGTNVTITGSAFRGGGSEVISVTLNGVEATILEESDDELIVVADRGDAAEGHIVVTSDSGAYAYGENAWTYIEEGAIDDDGISPTTVQFNTVLTLVGSNLLGQGSEATSVTIEGVAVLEIVSSTNEKIVVRVGEKGDARRGRRALSDIVTVSDTGAVAVIEEALTYSATGVIDSVTPGKGVGGSVVVIEGERLLASGNKIDTLTLGGTEANITQQNDTYVVVSADVADKADAADVVITADSGATITKEDAFEYLEPGVINAVEPANGQFGTIVVISGTSLFAGGESLNKIVLDGTEVKSVEFQTQTYISIVVASADASDAAGDIRMISDIGTLITGEDLWTYLEEGSIDSVTPDSGRVGTTVVIEGSNLRGGGDNVDTVTLDGEDSEITAETNTEVKVTVPAGSAAGAGSVVLTSTSGAIVSKDAAWTFVDSSIDSVTPASGQIGVVVTIAGDTMLGGGGSATSITLAGVEALNGASTVNDDEIVLTVPSGEAKTGDVVITADTGAVVTLSDGFEFLTASTIDSINPAKGQYGTLVAIEGSNLLGGGAADDETITSAKLGSLAAEVVFANQTYIVLNTKNGDAGAVDVTLIATSGATTVAEGGFTYLQLGVIQTVEPNFGQVGTLVQIGGERMLGGDENLETVTLVGTEAFVVTAENDAIVVRATDPSSVAQGDVVITAETGAEITLAGGFNYKTASVIDTVQPAEGQVGTVVTIKGSALRGSGDSVDTVTLGGAEATIRSESNSVVKVVAVQAAAADEAADVVVTANTGAVATLVDSFTYAAEGEVSDVTPASGQLGTIIVISGSALRGTGSNVSQVFLGDAEAEIVAESDDEVTIIATQGTDVETTVDVKLISSSGAIVTGSNDFKYLLPGVIKLVNPDSGQKDTEVTITGERLCGGGDEVANVTLAGLNADVVNPNCNLIQVKANELGAEVIGDVVVISNTGATVTLEEAFEYLGAGNITSVSPNAGQGTTVVTIDGNELLGGGSEVVSVTMAGVVAQVISDKTNADQLIVRANVGPTAEGSETGDVVVTGDTGVQITAINAFTYSTVTAIEPAVGQGGTEVTITGVALLATGDDIATVTLNGVEVESIVSASATEVIVVASAIENGQAQKGTAVITMDNGQVIESIALTDGSLIKEFEYAIPGAITSVYPVIGQLNTVVTIVGTSMFGQGDELVNVTLAGVVADIISQTNTKVVVHAGVSGGTATGDVILMSETGAIVEIASSWTYVDVGIITDISPAKGQLNTKLTITGSDLMAGGLEIAGVTLAGVAIKGLVSNSSTEVVVIAALSSTNITGDIVLTSGNGAIVVASSGWEYVAVPSFTELNPSSGQGGTEVTITGTGLLAGDDDLVKVTLKGIEATITSESDDEVVVVVGTGSGAGDGDVSFIMSSGATAVGEDLFEYLTEGDVTSVSPAKGQGNTVVTIAGTNLLAGGNSVSVTLANADVASVTSFTDEKIVVVVDAGSAAEGDVVITANTGAVVTETGGWTQLDEGVINDVAPANGREGTKVVISGERLLGGGDDLVSVTLDGTTAEYEAGNATDDSVTVIAAESDAGEAAGDVVLTVNTGATITSSGAFTYEGFGNVTGFSPDSGQYGTEVVISGEGLLGGGSEIISVKLVGVEATEIKSSSDTEVTVIADTRSASASGVVTMVADSGAVITSNENITFYYVEAQSINQIEPAEAQYGTRVTVSGDNLLGGGASVTSITMAGVEHVSKITSESNTEITVVISDGDAACRHHC